MKNTSILHEHQKTSAVVTLIFLVLFIFLFVLFTYTFLHESGHAITGLLFGQKLTEFDVNFLNFGAHVGMIGELTQIQQTIQSLAGAGLPLLIWFVFIYFVPRKGTFSLEVLKLLASLIVLNTLLAWIVLPILSLLGDAPPDDVTSFLLYSQMPPLLLSFTALVLYVRGWAYFLAKIDGLQNEVLLLHTTDLATLTVGTRRIIPALAAILALCILFTFLLNASADKSSPLIDSEDFVLVAEIDLSAQAYSAKELTQFTLNKPSNVDIFVIVRDIDTTFFDLSVIGPDGYRSTVLHGEGYNAYQDCCVWKDELPAGVYQLVLTSPQGPGVVSVQLKIH